MKTELSFIDIHEPATGRTSSLSVYGNRDDGTIHVVGGLGHNAGIVPKTLADADKLIAWLNDWKAKQSA